MFGLGTPELAIIGSIVVLLFGSTALPKLARALGESRRELRQISNESRGELP
jgi:TatA/E family protein of Tat protein translocase